MSKVHKRVTLGDYLEEINFEKQKFDRVSIVLHPDEICRAYGPKGDHVHWQNVVDAIDRVDKMANDGLTLNNYFVDFYTKTREMIDKSYILILYLGQYWNGSC